MHKIIAYLYENKTMQLLRKENTNNFLNYG